MPDSKKVIEGLKKAAEELARYAPMKVNGRCQMYFDGAIHLLKEQEAVKPSVDVDTYVCPNCGHRLEVQGKLGDNVIFDERYNFCPACGKAVKWDATD